jgi:hypothetical protein
MQLRVRRSIFWSQIAQFKDSFSWPGLLPKRAFACRNRAGSAACEALEAPMTRSLRLIQLAAVAALSLQLPCASVAGAQPVAGTKIKHAQARMMSGETDASPRDVFTSQEAVRAAHPITQGGTTGHTVNPGLTGDGMQHGYNGG